MGVSPRKAKEEAVVGDGLAVVTVVGAASCPIPDWLAPPQATNSPKTRRIVKPVAGLKKFDFIPIHT